MNRDREWDFIEDEKSLLATFAIVVRELAIKCPNDQELGYEGTDDKYVEDADKLIKKIIKELTK